MSYNILNVVVSIGDEVSVFNILFDSIVAINRINKQTVIETSTRVYAFGTTEQRHYMLIKHWYDIMIHSGVSSCNGEYGEYQLITGE